MHWIPLTTEWQLKEIIQLSYQTPQVIFKHSTRCSISLMVKSRLDRAEEITDMNYYYLDLLQYRPISNAIAAQFSVEHQSPQVLLIQKGVCTYHESQQAIYVDEIVEKAKALG